MKHHTRCLAALGLYAVSLLCLTDCHPAPKDPVDPPALTHSWETSSTESYQDALSSAPLSPEDELPFPEMSPAATETLSSSESTSTGSSLTETASPEDLTPEAIPTESSQTSQTETSPPETSSTQFSPTETLPPETAPPESSSPESSPSGSSPTESTSSEPVPPEPSVSPTEPVTSESPTTEPSTSEPPTTEAPTEPPTQTPAPSPNHNRSNGQLAFQRQNELLVQNSVAPLQWSEALYQIAAERAEVISIEYSHAGCPDWVGENLLRGVVSPDMAVQIWYDSDGHRQNMLAGWTYGAVANYGSYWAAVFAMSETP